MSERICGECENFDSTKSTNCKTKMQRSNGPTDFVMDCKGFEPKSIRQFSTGATRDTESGKLNYIKALSPIVLQRYTEYIGKHRKQSDGTLRDWDNWKQGIPQDTYLESMERHVVAIWLLKHGYPAFDNHGPVTLEDSLCGVIFNAMGMLHEILKAERKDESNPRS